MAETQATINEWQRKTFGPQDDQAAIYHRLVQEVSELGEAHPQDDATLAKELADVQIVLFQLAGSLGINLQAEVDRKMAINRKRSWHLHGDGTAQHIPDTGE
jgi:NTP pyrophosphatase (non-canonical NTP hydrolase)